MDIKDQKIGEGNRVVSNFLEFSYDTFSYKLFVPSGYKEGNAVPLMVMLHGCNQTPDDFALGTKMNKLAEKETFLVLYPAMNYLFNVEGCWNWFLEENQHRQAGEPEIIAGMIEEVKNNYSVDARRVYVAGLSAGGAMASIMGATYPDLFSGIALCSGLEYGAVDDAIMAVPDAFHAMSNGGQDPYECGVKAFREMGERRRKMPVIVFHGICDTTVHPINAIQVITQWAQTNYLVEGGKGQVNVRAAKVQAGIINGRSFMQQVYHDKNGSPLMELWLIDGMSHAWSGGDQEGSFTDPLGPDATAILWDFFKRNTS